MNDQKSPLVTLLHIIVGLVVLIVLVQIVGVFFRVISWLVTVILSTALLIGIVYMVYLLLKWAAKNVR